MIFVIPNIVDICVVFYFIWIKGQFIVAFKWPKSIEFIRVEFIVVNTVGCKLFYDAFDLQFEWGTSFIYCKFNKRTMTFMCVTRTIVLNWVLRVKVFVVIKRNENNDQSNVFVGSIHIWPSSSIQYYSTHSIKFCFGLFSIFKYEKFCLDWILWWANTW